jgi:hypothetical protein
MSEPNYQEIADCADDILLTLLRTSDISGDPERRRAEAKALQSELNARLHATCTDRDTIWVYVAALARVPSRGNVLGLLLNMVDTNGPEAFWSVDYDEGGQLLRTEPFRRVERLEPGESDGEQDGSETP